MTAQLVRMGYEKEYQVESSGQFAVRGGILDIFPLTEEQPVRVELWGDEVDTIRSFDVESQKSIETLEEIVIYPACEFVPSEEQKQRGISGVLEEAETVSAKLRGEMRTEEAYRVKTLGEDLAEQWGELSLFAGIDAYLSYFTEEKVGLLDYFLREDTTIFLDSLDAAWSGGSRRRSNFPRA
jgi:transcription-repair coupling factor (superfamily II helicase)